MNLKLTHEEMSLIRTETRRLHDMKMNAQKEFADKLFWTLSGSSVALLAFLGASEAARTNVNNFIALCSFGLGCFLMLVYYAVQFSSVDRQYDKYEEGIKNLIASKEGNFEAFGDMLFKTIENPPCKKLNLFLIFAFTCLFLGFIMVFGPLLSFVTL